MDQKPGYWVTVISKIKAAAVKFLMSVKGFFKLNKITNAEVRKEFNIYSTVNKINENEENGKNMH